jgi:ketosteroid isomerase-like protein
MRVLLATMFLMFTGAAACADDAANATAVTHQFIDRLDRGDMKGAAATYAPDASIIDEFPPHHWQGPTAFADWGRDFVIDSKKHSDTGGTVVLGKQLRASVEGDHAYVVYVATFNYNENGKPVSETGSNMTFALQRLAGVWRIAGWAWTTH